MSNTFSLDSGALSSFELAVIRFTTEGTCTFANDAARALLGDEPVGLTLHDFFPDAPERARLAQELGKRLRGQASHYPTTFTQPKSGARIPISVFALPETDGTGQTVGTVAIVRDLREEDAGRVIHEAIETLRTDQEILAAVAEELHKSIPFDEFRIVAVSSKRRHLRRIFSTDPTAERRYQFRWWPMPEFLLKTIDTERPRPIDIREMFAQPDYAEMAERDKASRDYLESGVRHSLSIPVLAGDKIAAFIGIDTKENRPYTLEQLAFCQRLPLAQAVLMALHFESQAQLQALVDLFRELGNRACDAFSLAQTLTDRLAASFGWDHVAVFQHDEDNDEFRVLSQSSGSDKPMNPDLVLKGNRGVVAQAFKTQEPVHVPDIPAFLKSQEGRPAPEYLAGIPDMQSELAVPIPGETHRWVLNVESRFTMAFSDEELETLRLLTVEAGHLLERAALIEMRTSILESINDAVVETDRRGVIRHANPAAERILACPEDQLAGKRLTDFIADSALAEEIARADTFSRHEVEMVSHAGERIWTLLSGAPLPKNLGGRVFVVSDLTYERELQKLSALKNVFRNASLESRLPLALAAGWLGGLCEKEPRTTDTVKRVLKQLRKADLPLERLLRLATPDPAETAGQRGVDLYALIAEVLDELPKSDFAAVRAPHGKGARVLAPKQGLRFCFESALSFALRTKPQDQAIKIAVRTNGKTAAILLSGDWSPDLGPEEAGGIRSRWRRQTLSDLALAAGEIEGILAAAGGRFRSQLDGRLMFELELPVFEKG